MEPETVLLGGGQRGFDAGCRSSQLAIVPLG
jgi:hypothetical protein